MPLPRGCERETLKRPGSRRTYDCDSRETVIEAEESDHEAYERGDF